MQARRRYRYDEAPTARSGAVKDSPTRYWGLAVLVVCVASWAILFGGAKLLLALI